MRLNPWVLVGLLIAATIPPAWAEQPEPSPSPSVRVIYRKSETHSFSGLKLKGQVKKPDLSYIYQRKGLRGEQIVNIPDNFDGEILQGADQF